MLNIVVDIGNTRTKMGVFDKGQLIQETSGPVADVLPTLLHSYNPRYVMVSSVNSGVEEVKKCLSNKVELILFDRSLRLPLTLNYKTPDTLGLDRLAAAIGAVSLLPNKTVLVIDAGSCITVDLVKEGKIFSGGVISPGLMMRFKAMNAYTNKLPLITWPASEIKEAELPGLSTQECLIAGVLKGITFELLGHVQHYTKQYPDLAVVMTGGDAQYFENKFNPPIFTEDSLVLIGLNTALEYNVT